MTSPQHFFISGTGTGVGKTIVCAGLASVALQAGRRCAVMKAVQTGTSQESGDLATIRKLVPGLISLPEKLACPYAFPMSASPHLAAHVAGAAISPEKILEAFREAGKLADTVLVEGAGGLLVPIRGKYMMIDLLREMKIPTILVSSASLGTINHTLLSLEALRKRNIAIAGIIINGMTDKASLLEKDNIATIKKLGAVPLLAQIPKLAEIDPESLRKAFASQKKLAALFSY